MKASRHHDLESVHPAISMQTSHSVAEDSGEFLISQTQGKRERLRFSNFKFTRAPSGGCRAEVELEWHNGSRYSGRAEGVTSALGDLRVAAEATLKAIEQFSGDLLAFELIGVKTMRAFDANIIIVSVMVARGDTPQRLLGCHLVDDDPLRTAVVAVLHATNRMLGNYISTR
jgi:hypothetical protein